MDNKKILKTENKNFNEFVFLFIWIILLFFVSWLFQGLLFAGSALISLILLGIIFRCMFNLSFLRVVQIVTVLMLPISAYAVIAFEHNLPRSVSHQTCSFQPGFMGWSYELHPESGEVDLDVGQGTGKTIKVTGVACFKYPQGAPQPSISVVPYGTDYVSEYLKTNIVDNYAGDPITLLSGNHTLISKSGTSHVVKCIDDKGDIVSDARMITWVIINYTEMDTGNSRIIMGTCGVYLAR